MVSDGVIRVVVVDDHALVREGLVRLLEQEAGIEVVGEAPDGLAAVETTKEMRPNVVVMDVSMPVMNGVEGTRQIVQDCPDVKVLALSAYPNDCFVADMLRAGASGYVLKNCMIDELVAAVKAVARDERYLSSKIAGTVIEGYITNESLSTNQSPLGLLSGRERQLLQLLAEGNSNKQAARLLHVSTKTVDARRRAIMHKLGIDSISELTKLAIREGVTSLEF